MRQQPSQIEGTAGEGTRASGRPWKLASSRKSHCPIILLQGQPARDGLLPHISAGIRYMSNMDTLVSVIDGVRQKDPERWRQFDVIYRPILMAYLRKQGLNETEANDVVQDSFVKLLGKIQTYDRTKSRFRTWLFSVAQNTLIDHARRRASQKKALEGWVRNMLQANPSDSVRMEEEWTSIHREKILAHALRVVRPSVSHRAWACFEQRVLHNLPADQIGRDLNLTTNSVYVYVCRVMKLVRSYCEEFDEDMSHAFESDVSRGR